MEEGEAQYIGDTTFRIREGGVQKPKLYKIWELPDHLVAKAFAMLDEKEQFLARKAMKEERGKAGVRLLGDSIIEEQEGREEEILTLAEMDPENFEKVMSALPGRGISVDKLDGFAWEDVIICVKISSVLRERLFAEFFLFKDTKQSKIRLAFKNLDEILNAVHASSESPQSDLNSNILRRGLEARNNLNEALSLESSFFGKVQRAVRGIPASSEILDKLFPLDGIDEEGGVLGAAISTMGLNDECDLIYPNRNWNDSVINTAKDYNKFVSPGADFPNTSIVLPRKNQLPEILSTHQNLLETDNLSTDSHRERTKRLLSPEPKSRNVKKPRTEYEEHSRNEYIEENVAPKENTSFLSQPPSGLGYPGYPGNGYFGFPGFPAPVFASYPSPYQQYLPNTQTGPQMPHGSSQSFGQKYEGAPGGFFSTNKEWLPQPGDISYAVAVQEAEELKKKNEEKPPKKPRAEKVQVSTSEKPAPPQVDRGDWVPFDKKSINLRLISTLIGKGAKGTSQHLLRNNIVPYMKANPDLAEREYPHLGAFEYPAGKGNKK